MKKNATLWQATFCLLMAALTLSGCGKKSEKAWFHKDYLAVQMSKGDSWSIIDKDGKEVVVEEYPADAQISAVGDGVFWVKQGDTYQLYSIDSPKKPVTDEEFAHATDFQAGVAVVANPNQQIRIIDTKGRTVATLPKSIKRCHKFTQWGYARFKNTDNKEGIIDTKGNIVLKPEYEAADVAEGMMLTLKDKEEHKIQMLDMNGKTLGSIDSEKHPIHTYSGGMVIARSSDADDAHIAAFAAILRVAVAIRVPVHTLERIAHAVRRIDAGAVAQAQRGDRRTVRRRKGLPSRLNLPGVVCLLQALVIAVRPDADHLILLAVHKAGASALRTHQAIGNDILFIRQKFGIAHVHALPPHSSAM